MGVNKKMTPGRLRTAKKKRIIQEQTNWFNKQTPEKQAELLENYKNKDAN